MASDNTKFIAYRERHVNDVLVKKFNGNYWTEYASGIGKMEGADTGFISMTSTRDGELFLAYNSKSNIIKTGSIGQDGVWREDSSPILANVVLDIVAKADKSGDRFLYYLNGGGGGEKDLRVLKSTGGASFDPLGDAFPGVYSADFIIDSDNRLVIAYANDDGVYAEVWTGSSWTNLGDKPILDLSATNKTVSGISLASSSNGKIYVAYEDWDHKNAVALNVFDGTNWTLYPYLNYASAPSLKVKKNGMPILAVRDLSAQSRTDIASVYFFENKKWQVLGRDKIEFNILDTGNPINMEMESNDTPVMSLSKGNSFSRSTSIFHIIDK